MSKQFHGFAEFKEPKQTKMMAKTLHLTILPAAKEPPTSAPNIGWLGQDAFAIDSKSWALLPAERIAKFRIFRVFAAAFVPYTN